MRDTFAFNPVAPAQAHPLGSGQPRGAQIIGGQSQGGAVTVGLETNPAPVAAGLGAFVEEIMRPHVQQRQQEEFFKGFTNTQAGIATHEISRSHGGFSKVFGPTSYEEGAAFYTAQSKLTDWAQERYAELDTLKRLPSDELAKVLAQKSLELLTGDPDSDKLLQNGLIEQSAALTNTVSKARYAWGQEQAIQAQSQSWRSGAGALQATAAAQAGLSAPADEANSALSIQTRAFLGSMTKPHGMDEETYKKGLFNFMRQSMQDGNFYAVAALRNAGVDNVFDDAERTRLEDAYHRYSQRSLEDFAATDQGFSKLAMAYEEARAHAALGEKGSMSPMDAAKHLTGINDYVRRHTGVTEDMFDFKDIRGEVRSISDLVVSSYKRAQDRQWQLEDRAAEQQFRREERQADNREAAAAAGAAWASGDVNAAIAGGVEEKHFNRIALSQFRQGDFAGMARAFTVGHYTSTAVKNDIQGAVEGSLEEQYGKNFAGVHQKWQAMLKVNPGMTASYFGDYHEKMRAFATLSRSVGPEAAYRKAFGDPARYSSAEVPPQMRKAADEAVRGAVSSKSPSRWNPFATPYSPQAIAVMQNVTRERVALGLKNSDTPADALAAEALSSAMADGTLQTAGGEAWRAAPGTKPFHIQVGLQPDEAGMAFHGVIDQRLRRAGLPTGASATMDINYVQTPTGGTALHVIGRAKQGQSANILIPLEAFKQYGTELIRKKLRGIPTNPKADPTMHAGAFK
ncbi:hypothetical protein [uncultured Sphingomonas sp.]|uniref:hypothetical protein n=1 Tax=uncultured Sphingomonas sp. TaxID=158754 RepID=UPI0025F35552|nr:hypothetical protein [uncultured Sphingomonas sp.]